MIDLELYFWHFVALAALVGALIGGGWMAWLLKG